MKAVCHQCGAGFNRRPSEMLPINFCTKKCRGAFQRAQPPARSLLEALADKSIPEPNSGCVLFDGCWNDDGYGQFRWNRKLRKAHQWAWIAHRGPIPRGKSVLHRCDVRCCVNPDHLFLGTQLDNIADMVAKGRHACGPNEGLQGERHFNRKLTNEAVQSIRLDRRSETKIALDYSISRSVVGMVRRRQAWIHVKDGALGFDVPEAA